MVVSFVNVIYSLQLSVASADISTDFKVLEDHHFELYSCL